MKTFLVAVLFVFWTSSESKDLFCWLCAGGSGSSFEECNTRKVPQNCSKPEYQVVGEDPLDRCAYFSFYSMKEKKRIYVKSCTVASFCTPDGKKFCDNIGSGHKATQCQVECCPDEKCNYRDQFKVLKNWTHPTVSPPATTAPSSKLTSTTLSTSPCSPASSLTKIDFTCEICFILLAIFLSVL